MIVRATPASTYFLDAALETHLVYKSFGQMVNSLDSSFPAFLFVFYYITPGIQPAPSHARKLISVLEEFSMTFTKSCFTAFAALAVTAFCLPSTMRAGTVILEGSDAIDFHGLASYTAQVWTALDGSSALPIAVIVGSGGHAVGSDGSGVTIDNFSSVAAAGTLSNYAALYFEGDGGDNEGPEGDSAITAAGASSAVSSYLAGGGTVMIEDYSGGAAWDPIVGTSGGANADVSGAYGGAGGNACSDGETVTPVGTANGFTQPPVIGCWEHQSYNEAFFSTLGFTKSFYDAAPDMGGAGWSGLLSSGVTLTGATPEPTSIILLSTLLLAVAWLARKRLPQGASKTN